MREPPTIAEPSAISQAMPLAPEVERLRVVRRQAAQFAEAAALFVLVAVFACLPVDWASALGGFIGRLIGPRLRVSRRALRNLERALPENSDAENRRILRGMWDNLGRVMTEYPHLAAISASGSGRVEIINGEGLADLMADGKGAIVFSGHIGNWEVFASTIHRVIGPSMLSIYRSPNNPWVAKLLRYLRRTRQGVAKGAAGGRELLRHLRQSGHVATLVDQKMNDGIAVPFFGRDAMTAPAIARLALRFGCPVVPVRVERLGGARFRLTVLRPVEVVDTDNATADVLATMTRINAMVESWVRARPEQWFWLHRRWPD